MKKIGFGMLLPFLALLLFASCEKDLDSNPTFHENTTGFVLNMPANAANNVLDLLAASELTFTTNQPDYGGIPLSTNYDLQVSFDDFTAESPVFKVAVSSTSAVIKVSGKKLNDVVVSLFQDANEGEEYPSGEEKEIYIRLRANVNGLEMGECFSNVIKLRVVAIYQAPSITLPEELFVAGSSVGEPWKTWKKFSPVYGLAGNYFTVVYLPDNGEFKWGTYPEQWLGHADITTIEDKAEAGINKLEGGNIQISKAGWYALAFKAKINGDAIDYTLTVYPANFYLIGNSIGGVWDDASDAWKFTAPTDANGEWESPEFVGGGEMRAYVKVGTFEWWRTEFTLFEGNMIWRTIDIPNSWGESLGNDYSVTPSAGQKLYLKLGTPGVDAIDKGEVR